MTRWLAISSIMMLCSAACGDLSPAEPSAIEREPLVVVSPSRPSRGNAAILYQVVYSVINPKVATESITLTLAEVTVLGPDGSVYGIATDSSVQLFSGMATLPPGQGRLLFGNVVDANTTRPIATSCIVRVMFTRVDGSTWKIEERSSLLPLI